MLHDAIQIDEIDTLLKAPDPDWTEEMAIAQEQAGVDVALTKQTKPMRPAAAWPFPMDKRAGVVK